MKTPPEGSGGAKCGVSPLTTSSGDASGGTADNNSADDSSSAGDNSWRR